jgi:single-strand DNA-binding protein
MHTLQITGNLTADAVIRNHEDQQILSFSVAVNEDYINKEGVKVESAVFYNCSRWIGKDKSDGRVPYLKKGTKVLVSGRPDARIYKNKEGENAIDKTIRIKEYELMGSKKDS